MGHGSTTSTDPRGRGRGGGKRHLLPFAARPSSRQTRLRCGATDSSRGRLPLSTTASRASSACFTRTLPVLSTLDRPEGVRGRNSENSIIKAALGWAPSISIKDGLKVTFDWIKTQIEADVANGVDVQAEYGMSKIAAREIVEGQAFDAM